MRDSGRTFTHSFCRQEQRQKSLSLCGEGWGESVVAVRSGHSGNRIVDAFRYRDVKY